MGLLAEVEVGNEGVLDEVDAAVAGEKQGRGPAGVDGERCGDHLQQCGAQHETRAQSNEVAQGTHRGRTANENDAAKQVGQAGDQAQPKAKPEHGAAQAAGGEGLCVRHCCDCSSLRARTTVGPRIRYSGRDYASELRNRWPAQRRKKHIFNALTSAKAQAANYPFCTIDPNTGVVTVPDERLDQICGADQAEVAGPDDDGVHRHRRLVRARRRAKAWATSSSATSASTDAICHVVRCFDDPEVVHVAGGVNPLHDIDIINTELLLADLDTVEKRYTKVEKLAKHDRATTRSRPSFSALQS